jgi:hypothetical protein
MQEGHAVHQRGVPAERGAEIFRRMANSWALPPVVKVFNLD